MNYQYDMGLDHADFLRLLPRLAEGWQYQVESTNIRLSNAQGCRVLIHLGEEGIRKMGLLRLPTTDVSLAFESCDEQQAEDFIKHFFRTYQRGGG